MPSTTPIGEAVALGARQLGLTPEVMRMSRTQSNAAAFRRGCALWALRDAGCRIVDLSRHCGVSETLIENAIQTVALRIGKSVIFQRQMSKVAATVRARLDLDLRRESSPS